MFHLIPSTSSSVHGDRIWGIYVLQMPLVRGDVSG
jgi:hypothetical protein